MFGLFTITLNSEAEIYRWVDKDGKVHFTDRKPAPEAENITKEVKPKNFDTSNSEIQKLATMREQEEKERQQMVAELKQEIQANCSP